MSPRYSIPSYCNSQDSLLDGEELPYVPDLSNSISTLGSPLKTKAAVTVTAVKADRGETKYLAPKFDESFQRPNSYLSSIEQLDTVANNKHIQDTVESDSTEYDTDQSDNSAQVHTCTCYIVTSGIGSKHNT